MRSLVGLLMVIQGLALIRGDKTALLIVDVQDCFLPTGSLPVSDGLDIIPVVNKIRSEYESAFSLVVLSKDWHCSDHVSFASQHPGRKVNDKVLLQYNENGQLCRGGSVPDTYAHARQCSQVSHNVTQILWPDHCVMNVTSGPTSSNLAQGLTQKEGDVVVFKGNDCQVDSYSMFYDNGDFRQTRLQDVLKRHKIDTVFVVGLALDYCVSFTALHAKRLGYTVYTVEDASGSIAPDTAKLAIERMKTAGVHVIKSASLQNYLTVSSGSVLTWSVAAKLILLVNYLL